MKLNRILVIIIISSLVACVERIDHNVIPSGESSPIENLKVPNGFNFKMTQEIPVKIGISSSGGRITGGDIIQSAIFGLDRFGKVYLIEMGHLGFDFPTTIQISKPLHIIELYLYTKYQGNGKYFILPDSGLELNYEDLLVDFEDSNGRVASVPSCESYLGSASKISCKNGEVIIQSSASFLELDIITVSGDTINYGVNEVGSTNNNQNKWTFENNVGSYPLSEIVYFTVYADCQLAPHTIDTRLVTFQNPCGFSADSDNDGVNDDEDVEPNNSDVSSVTYHPAKEEFSTSAFEDMWPHKGDFDFNDLVVSHNSAVYSNSSGFVTRVDLNLSVRAVGANFQNDLCISYSDANQSLSINSSSSENLTVETVSLGSKTELRLNSIRDVFAHQGFINTDKTKQEVDPVTLTFSLTFDGTTSSSDFIIDEYIRIDGIEGREVHRSGYPNTSLADVSLFGQADDDTRPDENKFYKSFDNLPWVLKIPIEWEYPAEKNSIIEAYPNFDSYVQQNPQLPWYTDEEGNKSEDFLFR